MHGAGLILLLFLFVGIFHYSRWALPEREDLPAVLHLHPEKTIVGVIDSGGRYSLHQLSDGSTIIDVINLTERAPEKQYLFPGAVGPPLTAGELVKVIKIEGNSLRVERGWLSAMHRILLGISLHPDTMTVRDWETLPGIGPRLAQAIEFDRQKNGIFGEFSMLKRVKGIGPKKLEAWKPYFEGKNLRK